MLTNYTCRAKPTLRIILILSIIVASILFLGACTTGDKTGGGNHVTDDNKQVLMDIQTKFVPIADTVAKDVLDNYTGYIPNMTNTVSWVELLLDNAFHDALKSFNDDQATIDFEWGDVRNKDIATDGSGIVLSSEYYVQNNIFSSKKIVLLTFKYEYDNATTPLIKNFTTSKVDLP